MKVGRNDPCSCGSGKKFKKCCASNESGLGNLILSPDLEVSLSQKVWLHGTDRRFNRWSSQPPAKDHLSHPHTALFFTTDIAYARGAGKNLAKVAISPSARVLDTTANYAGSEALRRSVEKDPAVGLFENVQHDYWHDGWRTGVVLRPGVLTPQAQHHVYTRVRGYVDQGLPPKAAEIAAFQNETRSLIETICVHAKRLGFDALYGHEIDRHSRPGNPIAQPWLAVMTPRMISNPEWV